MRIWVAGCATGEEPVSIAILLHEILGHQFADYNIRIFATDIDDVAIGKARKGIYSRESVELLPQHYIDHYFQLKGDGYEVKKVLRSILLFSRHDVCKKPPFLKTDLVVCRNMLIYFKNELQNQVLQTFHYSLNPDGLLFIGKSESLGTKEMLFKELDEKNKLFRSKGGAKRRGVTLRFSKPDLQGGIRRGAAATASRSTLDKVKDSLADVYHQPYLIIDEDQEILYMSAEVGKYLHTDAVLGYDFLADVSIGQTIEYQLNISANEYEFVVDGESFRKERKVANDKGLYYLLYPYFGGDQPAPHDIHMYIKEVF